MNSGSRDKYSTRYKLGEKLVDSAMLVYSFTHRLTPDSFICPHSLHCAMLAAENYFEKKSNNSFVHITFCELTQRVDVYINLELLSKNENNLIRFIDA